MFKRLDIRFEGAFCTCKELNATWRMRLLDNNIELEVTCITCKTMLIVPHASLRAQLVFEGGHQAKVAGEKPTNKLHLITNEAPVDGDVALMLKGSKRS